MPQVGPCCCGHRQKGRYCWGRSEIIAAASPEGCYGRHITEAERNRALAKLKRLEHDGRAKIKELGLASLYDASEEADRRYDSRFRQIVSTPAMSVAGLAIKVRLMACDISDGISVFGRRLATGAVKDAERLSA